tara:strand:- start:31840 stop:32319 length:480 start_codon:yes stop_codon:yes gene_type:complete
MQRIGRKHDPAFRVIVTESTRGPKSGDFIERVGHYHAKTGDKSLNKERISYWMEKGAKPSDTVHNFLVDAKIVQGPKKNVLPPKKEKKESVEGESDSAEKKEAVEDTTEAPATEGDKDTKNANTEEPTKSEKPKEETKVESKEESKTTTEPEPVPESKG